MSRNNRLIYVVAGIVFGLGVTAVPVDSLGFNSTPSTVTLQNQIETEYTTTQNIVVEHSGAATSYFITFSTGNSGSFLTRIMEYRYFFFFIRELEYQLVNDLSDRITLKDLSYGGLSSDEVLTGSFSASGSLQTQVVSFGALVPPEQFPVRGTYRDTITVSLYQGTLDNYNPTPVETVQMQVQATMPDYTKIAVVNPGDPFTPSGRSLAFLFGTLIWGESRNCDVVVRSNNAFNFRITSENLGVMSHIDPGINDSIGYDFVFDGQVLDLSSPNGATPTGWLSGSTGYEGIRYPVEVVIRQYGQVEAGTYQDNITITVTSY